MKGILLSIIFVVLVGLISIMDADFYLYLLPSPAKDTFQDKVVWITGASSGIGAAIAIDLCKGSTATVTFCASVDTIVKLVIFFACLIYSDSLLFDK